MHCNLLQCATQQKIWRPFFCPLKIAQNANFSAPLHFSLALCAVSSYSMSHLYEERKHGSWSIKRFSRQICNARYVYCIHVFQPPFLAALRNACISRNRDTHSPLCSTLLQTSHGLFFLIFDSLSFPCSELKLLYLRVEKAPHSR